MVEELPRDNPSGSSLVNKAARRGAGKLGNPVGNGKGNPEVESGRFHRNDGRGPERGLQRIRQEIPGEWPRKWRFWGENVHFCPRVFKIAVSDRVVIIQSIKRLWGFSGAFEGILAVLGGIGMGRGRSMGETRSEGRARAVGARFGRGTIYQRMRGFSTGNR